MVGMVGLDYETYGSVDLNKHGLARYLADPYFQPLMAQVAVPDYVQRTVELHYFDFVMMSEPQQIARLKDILSGRMIVAHNAPFEKGVLRTQGMDFPASRFIDSAVVARAAGAAGKLEAAAPQLLDTDKLESGKSLIKLFSIPGEYQEKNGSPAFDKQVVIDHRQEWMDFGYYCGVDSKLGLKIVEDYRDYLTERELAYAAVTLDMNETGWHVDVARVEEMQRRYLENQEVALARFRDEYDAADLNLNSLPQMKAWCEERGVKARSFNEDNVERLLKRVRERYVALPYDDPKRDGYGEVIALLETKQILGGSSLKKLAVILNTVTADGRLLDQYLHCGAPQTLRTTGRSVQMQNLKRLSVIADVEELDDDEVEWDNHKLAENMRQLFTASDPGGFLIVGDFSSVESRGLAWQAQEDWKLQAYREGKDLYAALASRIKGIPYDVIVEGHHSGDKTMSGHRQFGKVGELSCGYCAGGGAVKDFAAGMGVELSEGEANQLVFDWRQADPKTVAYWNELQIMLDSVMQSGQAMGAYTIRIGHGFFVKAAKIVTPRSLQKIHPNAQSLEITMHDPQGEVVLKRYFHGCYYRGKDICYYKPTERKTGAVWVNHYTHPKTKQLTWYKIYGGKLAGILTQSLCREIFFRSLTRTHQWAQSIDNVKVIGQFHDEIVLDWSPMNGARSVTLETAKVKLEGFMSDARQFPGFPLAADIKHDYRYTK